MHGSIQPSPLLNVCLCLSKKNECLWPHDYPFLWPIILHLHWTGVTLETKHCVSFSHASYMLRCGCVMLLNIIRFKKYVCKYIVHEELQKKRYHIECKHWLLFNHFLLHINAKQFSIQSIEFFQCMPYEVFSISGKLNNCYLTHILCGQKLAKYLQTKLYSQTHPCPLHKNELILTS